MASDEREVEAVAAAYRAIPCDDEYLTVEDVIRITIAALDAHRAKVGPSGEDIEAGLAMSVTPWTLAEGLNAYLAHKAAQHAGEEGK